MRDLRQSTSATVKVGPLVDSNGDPLTTLTIQKADLRLSKNGGDMAAASADQGASDAGAPHDELGVYDCSLNTTDTNTLGHLCIVVRESGQIVGREDFNVMTAEEWDARYSTGIRQANVTQISGDGTAADNAESFFDGTGYAGTNNVIPTVTTLTNAPNDSSGITTLLSRLPAGLFTGLSNFAHWLGALAGKQSANSTALTEIRASGAGSGTYDPTTDSLEAIKDDAATIDDVVEATGRVFSFNWSGVQRAVPLTRTIVLESFATGQAMTNPTIASSDWKISKDGGAFANLATLPDVEPDGTNQLRIQLSESELDADTVVILGIDQTDPKEWRDTLITIQIVGSTVKVATDGSNAAGTFKISTFGMGTEATDMLKPAYLKAITGALKGQVQKVSAYNSTTDFVTVSPAFPSTPADGVYFQVVNG